MSRSREKFVKLAESRTNSIIKTLHLLGNLSNKSNYQYNEDDVRKIFSAINNQLKEVRNRFEESSNKDKTGTFKL